MVALTGRIILFVKIPITTQTQLKDYIGRNACFIASALRKYLFHHKDSRHPMIYHHMS